LNISEIIILKFSSNRVVVVYNNTNLFLRENAVSLNFFFFRVKLKVGI